VRSIRARLLAWLFAGVVFVGAAGGLIVYRNALIEADAFFDYHLRQTALILRDEPVEYSVAAQLPANDAAYDFVVQVWTLDGVRVYLSRPHSVLPNVTTLGFSSVTTSEGRWREALPPSPRPAHIRAVGLAGLRGTARVYVKDQTSSRCLQALLEK